MKENVLIKVFLVEDEVVIRNGIKNSISWEKEGYAFVGEASDGELAYPMIKKERPDILITDIRMPFMDGLELSRIVRRELPDIKILILSGYNEFDYAKEAIRLGVTDYLLKPISQAKLLEALDEVKEVILQEREEKALLERYAKEMRENTEHEKSRFFHRLINGALSMGEAIETGRTYGMDLTAGAYNLLLFKIMANSEDRAYAQRMVQAFADIEERTGGIPRVYSVRRGIDGWAFLLAGESEKEVEALTDEVTGLLTDIMASYEELEYFGGIGNTVLRIRELGQSFRDADRAFAGRFVKLPNRIISEEEARVMHEEENIRMQGLGNMEEMRRLVERFLGNGTAEETESFVNAYFEEIPEDYLTSNMMRRYIIMDLYVTAMAFCRKLELPQEQVEEEESRGRKALQSMESPAKFQSEVKHLLEHILELRDAASGRRYSDIIETAQKYIGANYMSEEISLNTVSAQVNMSPSYFSTIFSKEAGQTFVEYLTRIRMEKAKELLMCSSLKTSEIGYEVGYKDPHYFSYIFKKTQSCTPKEYRSRGKEQG